MAQTATRTRTAGAMTRCECQQRSFAEAVAYAKETGVCQFDMIREGVGIGQICTGCHCDLKRRLAQELGRDGLVD